MRYPYSAVTFNLDRMRALLRHCGDPHQRFNCVHIAGTKGKGSTSAMVESVLRAAGYRTGLYTSPHLHTVRERIRVNGALLAKHELVDLVARYRPAIEATPDVTAFEIMTALGFAYFAEREVEWAVLEVGLGGRLDATNVVQPAVCAITSLSYDHVELLGHTLSLIAWEKAGIIKANVPVVSAPQEAEAMAVIERVCADTGARLIRVGTDWVFTAGRADWTRQSLTIHRPATGTTLADLSIALLGRHQLTNATTAVAMLAELQAQGVQIPDQALRAGLATAHWPGRFEILNRRPLLVVDSAHNADSAHKLQAALADWFLAPTIGDPDPEAGPVSHPPRRLALIFGASADKDIGGMLETFLRPSLASRVQPPHKVIVTKSNHPRSADPARLADQVRSISASCPISVHDGLEGALTEALAWAQPNDLICVTGSIFVVAQARLAWSRRHPSAFPPDDWVFQDETVGEVIPDDEVSAAVSGATDQ